ncbi:MAG: glycosyltransferase family 4 protein [Methanobrevibacter sp.]|nr:glycosyltransferase family 4 protein [Methanobrevibacter sp.]
MTYTINGKFLSERITGMQRYAIEIVKELDKISKKGELQIIVPKCASDIPDFQNISVVRYGKFKGIPWEQISLPFYLYSHGIDRCLNLLSIVPFLMPKGIIVAHGVNYKVNPQFFNTFRDKLSRLWHISNYKWYFTFTKKIVTVSFFSQSEIMRVYHVPENRITIASNAWQHMNDIVPSVDTLDRFNYLKPDEYYYSLSSVNDNKNFKWIIQVAIRNPKSQFAIAGGRSLVEYLQRNGITKPDNVYFLGYVSDEDNKTLMTHCRAFLFPTFYEGFGIPPMEAMSCGAAAIVSDTPTMHEVYEDTVHYIDPHNYDVDLDKLINEPVAPADKVLKKYSWKKSAKDLYARILE